MTPVLAETWYESGQPEIPHTEASVAWCVEVCVCVNERTVIRDVLQVTRCAPVNLTIIAIHRTVYRTQTTATSSLFVSMSL